MRPAIHSSARTMSILVDYASKFWSGTITAAESAERPDAASALLLSITACLENRYCT